MAFGDVVQKNKGTGTTATTTPTLGSSITAGNLVVLTFAADDYNGTPDSGWIQSAEMEQQTFHGCYIWWFIASGGDTIPGYTIGSNTVSAWVVTEFEGPFDDSPVSDSQGQFAQSSSGSYTTDNTTPPTGDHLLVAAIGGSASSEDVSGAYSSWLNSFVEVDHQGTTGGGTDDCIGTASRVVTGDGSTAFSSGATYPNAVQSRTGLIIAFKAAAAAPPQYGRNYYPKRSAGDVSTTSNTVWSTVASKTFTPEASTDYWVIWSGDVRVASTSNDVQHRIFDGTTAYDAGNLEANDTAPNEYFSAAGVFKYTSGGSPSAITFSFQVKAETNGTTVSGRNAQIVIIKAKSTDQWVETTGSSATSTTEQTKQTLTWTPDQTRDYIVIGAGAMIDASTTGGMILRLKDGTPTTQSTSYGASNDGTNVVRGIVVDYAPGLTAVSQTFTLTTQDVGSSGGSISDRRILALDVTGENVWENTAGDGSTNNTASYADSKTFTQSLTNTAEHLVLMGGGMAGNSTSVTGMVQTVIDGTSVGETVQENSSTANMIFNHNVVWLGTLSSGSRTFKTQAKNESGTVTVKSYQTKFVVWDIQTGAPATGAIIGSTTLTFSQTGDLKGSGALAGTSTLTFAPTGNLIGQAPISGTTSLTFTPTATGTATAAAEGTTSLTFTPSGTLAGSGALAGTAALALTPSATLTGDGALAGTAALTFSPSATLLGEGALSGTSPVTFSPAGNLEALSGAISGTCSVAFSSAGSLLGDGALAGSVPAIFTSAAILLGSGALTGLSAVAWNVTATLLGIGALTGASPIVFDAAGILAGDGALAGTSPIQFLPSGQLIGGAPISGAATVTFTPAGDLQALAQGDISGAAAIVFSSTANLAGDGALSGATAALFSPTGLLIGLVDISGTASAAFTPAGLLAGDGLLGGLAALAFSPSGLLVGAGALAGEIEVAFLPGGTIYDDSYWLRQGQVRGAGGCIDVGIDRTHKWANNVTNPQLIAFQAPAANVVVQPGSARVTIEGSP